MKIVTGKNGKSFVKDQTICVVSYESWGFPTLGVGGSGTIE